MFRKTIYILAFMAVSIPAFGQPTNAPNTEVLGDCFSQFQTHDDWSAFMREKNGFFKGSLVSLKVDEEEFDHYKSALECKYIRYNSGGIPVRGIVVYPKNRNGTIPAVIYNRGGNGSFGAMNFTLLFSYAFPIADEGFAIFISQYRGLDNTTGNEADQFGGKDVEDVLQMIEVTKTFPFTDQKNLFMLGKSRGAMMSFLTLARTEAPIRASATVGGLVDLLAWRIERPEVVKLYEARIPGFREREEETLLSRSPLYWPEQLPPNTSHLLLHGSDDTRVDWKPARLLSDRMKAIGISSTFKLYDGDDHTLSSNRLNAISDIVTFFRANIAQPE